MNIYRKENEIKKEKLYKELNEDEGLLKEEDKENLINYNISEDSISMKTMNNSGDNDISPERQLLLMLEFEKDKNNFPFYKMFYMIIAYITLIIVALLKGSEHFNSLVNITK